MDAYDKLKDGYRWLDASAGRCMMQLPFHHPPTIFNENDGEAGDPATKGDVMPFHTRESIEAAEAANDPTLLKPLSFLAVGVYVPVAHDLFRTRKGHMERVLRQIMIAHHFVAYGAEANNTSKVVTTGQLQPKYPIQLFEGKPTPRHRSYLQIFATSN